MNSILRLCSNGDFDLDTGFNIDNNLLDDLCWCIEIYQTLVNTHFKCIPSLATFTVGGFTGRDAKVLGWKSDWALDAQVLALGTVNQLRADFFEGLDIARSQGNANLVNFDFLTAKVLVSSLLIRHFAIFGDLQSRREVW